MDASVVRLMFMGNGIEDTVTPEELGMEDGDEIDAMLNQAGSIGIFVCNESIVCNDGNALPATSAPGAQWLMQPALPHPLPTPEAVAAVAAALHGSSSARPPLLLHSAPAFSCVSLDACAALRARVDGAHRAFVETNTSVAAPRAANNDVAHAVASHSCADDFRMLLSLRELLAIVGKEACACILAELETDSPDAIALRRTTASGRWINFHTDTAARTVQVPGS